MRINVYIAQQLNISRRQADKLIESKQVIVNGKRAQLGQIVDPATDRITVQGKPVQQTEQKHVTIALYKPKGYVTTKVDPKERKTVMNLLPKELQHVKPVGRLDYDSEGLLLLSTNGEFIYKATHPKYRKQKEYRLVFKKPVTQDMMNAFKKGIRLEEGMAKADSVRKIENNEIEVIIHQGWNRQLRRMAERCHYEVFRLIRTRFDTIRLDNLQPGEWRYVDLQKKKS